MDSLIGVAQDISPEWAEWLRSRRQSDPEGLRKAIQTQGRRLIALAVLREHSPDLYELKVTELRLQSEVGDITRLYHDAVAAGDTAEADRLLRQLRAKTAQQVDESLKSRAAELAAMDQQVLQLRKRLEEDSLNRQARIDELLKAIVGAAGTEPLPKPPGESGSSGAPTAGDAGDAARPSTAGSPGAKSTPSPSPSPSLGGSGQPGTGQPGSGSSNAGKSDPAKPDSERKHLDKPDPRRSAA